MPYYPKKSDWAAAEAAKAWAEYRRVESAWADNYARKRRVMDTLRSAACVWDSRVARYRREEEQRAA
jgi:hypothetical protein